MKRTFILLICVAALTVAYLPASAQSTYKNAIGLRLGSGYYDWAAVSFKTFVSRQGGAMEFNLGFDSRGRGWKGDHRGWRAVSFAGTYQHHFPIPSARGLQWFIGGGAVITNSFSDDRDYEGFGFGIYPTGGIDYKFNNIPLNLSADVRPTLTVVEPFSHYNHFYPSFGIAARFTF